MGNSSNQLSRNAFEQEADRCIKAGDATLSTITAYQVATRLGRNANSTAYKYFRAWKAQRLAAAAGPPIQIPAEFERGLASLFDRFKADYLSSTTEMMSSAMRKFDDSANLKVAEEQRGRAEDNAALAEILAGWELEEQEHQQARDVIDKLEADLLECRAEKLRLEGRLEQIMMDRAGAPEATDEADHGDDDGYRPF